MKRFAAFVLLAWLLAACATTAPAPLPTYTPLSTYTPYPTYTPPRATSVPPAAKATLPIAPASSAVECVAWKDAAAHVGETRCVRGTVYSTYQSGSTFFIDFDGTRASFYGVSFRYTFDDLRGKCVEISGKISPYRGRPQIVIDSKEQVKECAD